MLESAKIKAALVVSVIDAHLAHPAAKWVLLCGSLAVTGWLWFIPRPPGYAIAGLAFIAALMTVAEFGRIQKVAFVAALATLLYAELNAIQKDRTDQEAAARSNLKAILDDNRTKTKVILDNANRDFSITQKAFDTTLNLSKESLQQQIGGDSYAYAMILNTADPDLVSLQVINASKKYTVRNVRMTISGPATGYVIRQINVGDISPRKYVTPDSAVLTPSHQSESDYTLFFEAANGNTFENLHIRKTSDGWVARGDVNKVAAKKIKMLFKFP